MLRSIFRPKKSTDASTLKSSRANEVLKRNFIYIVGSPRSGTSWLQTMLGDHPDVVTTVELTLFNRYVLPWVESWRLEIGPIKDGKWHQGLPFLFSELEFKDIVLNFLGTTYGRVLETKPFATHILDKHPGYAFCVETICEFLPKAKIIHIIRDGRDVVVSMLAARRDLGFGGDTIECCAKEWKESILAARKLANADQYYELRYEDLMADAESGLKKVLKFCELNHNDDLVNRLVDENRFEKMKWKQKTPVERIKAPTAHFRRGRVGAWRDEMSLQQVAAFQSVGGDLLHELGYAES